MLIGLIETVSGVSGWIRGSKQRKQYIHTWQVTGRGRNSTE